MKKQIVTFILLYFDGGMSINQEHKKYILNLNLEVFFSQQYASLALRIRKEMSVNQKNGNHIFFS